jgi:hypothetical protein
VKRVYLDMWAWIRLTDARKRRETSAAWSEVYDLAEAAVGLGAVSFPLSSSHYMEVAKAPKLRRVELALTMATLSHWHAIIGPIPALVQSEIAAALDRRFGPSPVVRAPLRIFGRGYGHVFRAPANDDSRASTRRSGQRSSSTCSPRRRLMRQRSALCVSTSTTGLGSS